MPAPQRKRSVPAVAEELQQMIAAVEGEIAACRRADSDRWERLGRGRKVGGIGDRPVYAFGRCPRFLRPGRTVRIKAGDETAPATVLAARKGHLLLRSVRDFGPRPRVRLRRPDAIWLLEELKTHLSELRRGGIGRLPRLLLHPTRGRVHRQPPSPSAQRALEGLNPRQREAVEQAAGSEICYLWGPPGTGKTRTLGALIEALHRSGRTVLALAPTNTAVDHLMMEVADRLAGEPDFRAHRILRLGPIERPELKKRFGQYIALDRLAASSGTSSPSPAELGEAIREVCRRLVGPAEGEADLDPEATARLRARLNEDLVPQLEREAWLGATQALRRARYLQDARVVTTTLHRAYLPGQLARRFDAVVVDEASAASFPLIFAAADRAKTQLTIAGDFRQLPPVVRSRKRRVRPWMGRDAFEVGGLAEAVGRGKAPSVLSVLTRQYRMRPKICRFVSGLFYEGRLETVPTRNQAPAPGPRLPFNAKPLVVVDTQGLAISLVKPERRENIWHGLIALRLLQNGRARSGSGVAPPPSVALLTPYRKQASLLNRRLGNLPGVTASTVHKAQGREFDVVILDMPEAPGVRPSPFVRARELRDAGARLLNVAASRARDQLIVIADGGYFANLDGCLPKRFLAEARRSGSVLPAKEILERG